MSLINELRNADKQKEELPQSFSPLWLRVVQKKGIYLLSQDSLIEFAKECRQYGITFETWLDKNGMYVDVLKFGNAAIKKKNFGN